MQHDTQFLNVRQVAQRLGISCSLLHKLKRMGAGPTFYRFGRSVRYAVTDVDDWAKSRPWKSIRRRADPANPGSAIAHP